MTAYYCKATHPAMPNHDPRSRGRKEHLTVDEKVTLCNLAVTSMQKSLKSTQNGRCKSCEANAVRMNIEFAPLHMLCAGRLITV